MKKLLSVIVLAAMLVTMICPSFAAAVDSHDHSTEVKEFDGLTFSVDDVVVQSGTKTVDVAVRVAGNGEHNCKTGIWGAAVSLYYPDDLKVVDVKNGDLFPDSEALFDVDKWNASTPDPRTLSALNENEVEIEGEGYSYGYGRFVASESDYFGGVLENGVLFTVTVELPEGTAAGDSWVIGIVANKDDVSDCGTEVVDDDGKTVIEYYDIPFALDNGSVAVAYNTEISVGSAAVAIGGEVTVPVTIADNPGIFISRLTATYDAEKLEFVDATCGDITEGSYVITNKVEDGNLTLYFESTDDANISGDGVLLYLTFKAGHSDATLGDAEISLVAEDAINIDGKDIDVTLNAGVVTVLANTVIAVADASVVATGDVKVPVDITSNAGIWALRAEFTYDADLLTFKGIESGIYTAVEGENYSVKDGVITVFFEDVDGTACTDDGTIFSLLFTSGRKAGTSAIGVNLIDAINEDGADLDVETVSGVVEVLRAPTIAVGSVEAYADKTVEVPVTVSGNEGVLSVRMEIDYDASALEFVGVTSGLFSADETNASANDGVITVFVENDTVADMTENGVLFNLVFKTLKNEDAEIALRADILADSTINAEGAEVMFLAEDGTFTVKAHEHDFVVERVDATCTEDGIEIEACAICETVKSETVLPAAGHTEGAPETLAATCEDDGYTRFYCTVCDRLLRETVLKATGHDWVESAVVVPNCCESGYTEYTCSVCGETKTDDVLPPDTVNGHEPGEKVITAEATYESAGAYEICCTICDEILESGIIPRLSDITVTVGDASVKYGKEVSVPVVLDGSEGLFIVRLIVSYDADKLTYVGAENGEVFEADNVIFNNVEDGTVVMYFEAKGDADTTANGVLADLKFKASDDIAAVGATDVNVQVEEAVNYNDEDVYILAAGGTVEIGLGCVIAAGDASTTVTGDVEVPVTIESNEGVWAVRAELAYDADMLTFVGIKSGLFEIVEGESYSVEDGVVTVFVEVIDPVNVTEDGVLFTLQFTAGLTDGETAVDVTLLDVVNADSEDVEVIAKSGVVEIAPLPTLVVGTVDAYSGKPVEVPVTMNLNPGVYSIRMEIAYDAENLEFTGVSSGMFSADETNASANDGVITVFVENDVVDDVTGDGVAFYLNFEVVTDADAEYVLDADVTADSTVNASSDEVVFLAEAGKIVMHVHSEHEAVEEITEATCTDDGLKVEKCSVCGEVLSEEVIPATGHAYEATSVVEPTCITTGYTLYVCANCGAEEKRDFTDMIDHVEGEAVVVVEPTCVDDGLAEIRCAVCNEFISEVVVSALGHDWVKGEVVDPTCTVDGYTVYECSRCDATENRDVVPATGEHTPGEVEVTKEPTCIETGVGTVKCTVCDEVIDDNVEIPALGHDWVEGDVVDPTCTEDGYTVYECSRCDVTENRDVVPATGEHTPGEVEVTKEPTCTDAGVGTVKCTVCDEVIDDNVEIPTLGHDWVEGDVVDPTCTEDGYTVYECSRCDATENRDTVDALGHTPGEVEVVTAPTCTDAGEGQKKCTVCGEVVESDIAIDALGHDWVAGTTVAPTCVDEGYTPYTCTRCGKTENRDIVPATDMHTPGEQEITVYPTEDAEGTAVIKCTVCGKVLETITLPKLEPEHTHTEAEKVETPATCVDEGVKVIYCSVCGEEIRRETIPATGVHTPGEVEVVTAPTCTDAGVGQKKCTVCGEVVESDIVIDALGHDWVAGTTVAPTCVDDGYTPYTCTRCGKTEKRDIVPATGVHSEEYKIIEEPTCQKEGKAEIKCAVCGEVIRTETIEKLSHNFDGNAPITEKHATCTEDGIISVTCNLCHQRIELIDPAKGHLRLPDPETFDPTCEEDGCIAYVCMECDEILEVVEILPATGHKWVEKETVPSEPGKPGYILYVCENDPTHERREYLLGEYIYGDVNGDGVVDSDDTVWMLKNMEEAKANLEQSGCDFDRDGDTDYDDAIYLLYHVLLPERFPLIDPKA